jgi:hypothetical protein
LNTIPRWIKTIANIFVVLTPILSLLYVSPEFMRPFIPLPTFLAIKHAFPFILCIGFIFFVIALLLSKIRPVFKVVIITVMSVLFCISAGGVFDTKSGISSWETLLSTVQLGNSRYNLVEIVPLGDPSNPCYLYKCDINDLGCEEISSYVDSCWSSENPKLVANPSTNEVNIFIDDTWSDGRRLVFTYGDQPRSYEDVLKLPGYDYYAVYLHEEATYTVYRCETDSMHCVSIPFHYDADEWPNARLQMDEQNGDIQFFIRDQLIYTYGNSPKCYVENCFFTEK